MKLSAEFVFESGEAEKIYMSVLPELNDAFSDRSLVGLSLEADGRLVLTVRAEDAVSMRSALNTWFRLIQIAQEVSELTAAAQ
ncbi:KEOPS complex subunit Pcc1 [Methanosarcina sp. Mfa9]|uniref:KEOPS complex subunit Pcc1 n=1 Tax=Methanosarcina sp. Mfa9 TaxID=3439063 RepID=UPI003F843C34